MIDEKKVVPIRRSTSFTAGEVKALMTALSLLNQDVARRHLLTAHHRKVLKKVMSMRDKFEKDGLL